MIQFMPNLRIVYFLNLAHISAIVMLGLEKNLNNHPLLNQSRLLGFSIWIDDFELRFRVLKN